MNNRLSLLILIMLIKTEAQLNRYKNNTAPGIRTEQKGSFPYATKPIKLSKSTTAIQQTHIHAPFFPGEIS